MSELKVTLIADAGENIVDIFKSAYYRLQHPDIDKLEIEHNGKRFTITVEEIEQKKEQVEIYCNHGNWVKAGITEPEIWNDSSIRSCELSRDGYRYYFDDYRLVYRFKKE